MTQAIGFSPASASVNRGAATASLQAQLSRYQKQLSECVNCDSSKTEAGKEQIQTLSARISELKQRIDKVAEVKTDNRSESLTANIAAKTDLASDPAKKPVDSGNQPASAPHSTLSPLGNSVDVYA